MEIGNKMEDVMKSSLAKIAALALLVAPQATALAAEYRNTSLTCTLGETGGNNHRIDIRNSSGKALPKDTIINYTLKWARPTMPGESAGCFAIDKDLAPNLQVIQRITLAPDALPKTCSAFVSGRIPKIVRGIDGGIDKTCDNE
jgi:hypothetical protein